MNWIVLLGYYFWIFFSIFVLLFVRFSVVSYYDNEPIKLPGWGILISIIVMFIPILNILLSISFLCAMISENKVKSSVIKFFKNLWIVKILAKEY